MPTLSPVDERPGADRSRGAGWTQGGRARLRDADQTVDGPQPPRLAHDRDELRRRPEVDWDRHEEASNLTRGHHAECCLLPRQELRACRPPRSHPHVGATLEPEPQAGAA
jgi:hypothetical protein